MRPSEGEIRALADRFIEAGGKRIALSAKTALLVAHALRNYADDLGRPCNNEFGLFTVEALAPHSREPQIIARTGNERVASFAYEQTLEERPKCRVTLRHSNRVLKCSGD